MKGHRREQLRILNEERAVSRESAIAPIKHRELRPVTLSRMVGEGLVNNEYMAFGGDPKRRLSHYWLTAAGRTAAT